LKSIWTKVPAVNPEPVTVRMVLTRPEVGLRLMDAAAAGVAGITNARSEITITTTKTRKVLLYFI